MNNFPETIKFTYNYPKTNAVFLDVKIEKSDEGILGTSVFEKDTNVHQYIESNRKVINRNWCNQKANPALKTKTGNK